MYETKPDGGLVKVKWRVLELVQVIVAVHVDLVFKKLYCTRRITRTR
jgi:hypothetical protein